MKNEYIDVILFGLINLASILFFDARIGTVVSVYVLHIALVGIGILVHSYVSTRDTMHYNVSVSKPWNNFVISLVGLTLVLGIIGMTAGTIFMSKGADIFTGERAPDPILVFLGLIPALIVIVMSVINRDSFVEPLTEHKTLRPIVYLALGSIPVLILLYFSDAIADNRYKFALVAYTITKILIDSFLIKVKGVHGA